MKKRFFALLFVCLAICILTLSGCVSQSRYNELLTDFASLQAQVSQIENELSSTKATLQQTQNNLVTAQKSLSDTQKALADAQAELKLYSDRLGITVYSEVQPNYSKIPGVTIALMNNPTAKDPTWQQLLTFIASDKTDSQTYIPNVFMCGGFAEMVHNNAERYGIEAALVFVKFQGNIVGHALNAFKTSDRGLVYIDCTGPGLQDLLPKGDRLSSPTSWDKIAYVSKDKEYGLLGMADNVSFDYMFYETEQAKWDTYKAKLDAYNADVEKFNAEIAGKVYYIGTPQWERIKQWEASLILQSNELKSIRATLSWVWKPLGVVSKVEMYW